MADYSDDIKSAYEDIKDSGVAMTINRKASGTFIPNLGITAYQSAQLNADIDAVETTLTMKSETGTFYSSGTIWIGREQITYTGITDSDLTGLTRGYSVTDAAVHAEDSNIYLVAQDSVHSTYALITSFKLNEVVGTSQMGDRKLLIPAYGLSIVPSIRDTVTINSIDWMIVNIMTLQPSNQDILYTCHIRGINK